MKILQINIFGNLSTGKIAVDLYRSLKQAGHEGVVAFARNTIAEDVPNIKIGSKWSVLFDGIMTRLTDRAGFYSKRATKKLIAQIKEYDPDIIHLHNLHGYYINIELLFAYLRESGKPVVWTLHDCWAFTGHCCYYSAAGCDKWKYGCSHCPQIATYPRSWFCDNSEWNFKKKIDLFTSLPHLHLVCVSNWLESELEKSFLRDVPHQVIHNGIDTEAFRPIDGQIKQKYGIPDKKVILAVSTSWGSERKGLNDVIQLANRLDSSHCVVIVGLSEQEKKALPNSVIGITRTDSTQELAELYSAADYYFNASVEETFGLPTVEAMACGTPVIVYDATALPEVVSEQNGFVVREHDLNAVQHIIESEWHFDKDIISKSAAPFGKKVMMENYLSVYKRLVTE